VLTLKKCYKICYEKNVSCPCENCRFWINYEKDLNCILLAIKKNGNMTLKEVANRMETSLNEVLKIEKKTIAKIKKLLAAN
jgi:hypothetical protein